MSLTNNFKLKKYYCCLHHYLSGKNQKANTPCYQHVPLGVINPIHNKLSIPLKQQNPNFQVKTQKWTLKSHTHFYNDIKNKQSLPKRLVQPRIYVGQVYSRGKTQMRQTIRPPLSKKSFDQITQIFQKFAHTSNCHTFEQLHRKILSFMESKGIPKKDQNLLFLSTQFLDFVIRNGMNQQQARQFYEIAFRQNLFKQTIKSQANLSQQRHDLISMRAFIYNFKKFYVDPKSYKRMFSTSALKQRLIDLRLHLQPWNDHNIILKNNMQRHRLIQFQILQQLAKIDQNLYAQLLNVIQRRNSQWMYLRTIAKTIYKVTDGKGFSRQQLQNMISQQIQRKTQQLRLFAQFVKVFLEDRSNRINQQHSQSQSKGQYKATQLIQFLRDQKKDQNQARIIIKYIRGIFKYFFFFKQNYIQQGQTKLLINKKTLNLDCINGILQINNHILSEFIQYKKKILQDIVKILNSLMNRVQMALQDMPNLQTHAKEVVEKNYIVQSVLRAVKQFQSFKDFYILWEIVYQYQERGFLQESELPSIVGKYIKNQGKNQNNYQLVQVPKEFKKILFSFERQKQAPQMQEEKIDKIALALQKYEQSKNTFPQIKRYVGKNQNISQNKSKKSSKDVSTTKMTISKKVENKNMNESQDSQTILKNKQVSNNLIQKSYHGHSCSKGFCSICGQIPQSDITSTIQSVQSMESRIFSLLGV